VRRREVEWLGKKSLQRNIDNMLSGSEGSKTSNEAALTSNFGG